MTPADLARIFRWRRTTVTWFAKTVALLRAADDERNVHVRAVLSYEAEILLREVLADADRLVAIIAPDELRECERHAKALTQAIRRRRIAEKLAHVEGRTPEEAATFAAKADQLR